MEKTERGEQSNFLIQTISGLILSLLLSGCGTVALTGRSQLSLVSDAEMISAANEHYSKFINTASSKNAVLLPSESVLASNMIASVNRVSNRIIDAAGLRGKYNWQVTVVKSNVPNAFVLANGKIVVYTGLFPIVKNEAGLAAVIGHEVAHAVARHGAERMSLTLLAQSTRDAVDAYAASQDPKNRAMIGAALGLGAQYGVLLPFSRQHESEADRIGQIYMAKAGYDPAEAIAVWVRMTANAGKSSVEFASTHPSNETRQVQLRTWLPDAMLYFSDGNRPLPNNLEELNTARIANEQQKSLSPVALKPSVKAGYWYKSRIVKTGAETTYKYESIEPCSSGACINVSSSSNTKGVITTDGKLVRSETATGGLTTYTPAVRTILFPLRVGDAWEDLIEVESPDGKKRRILFKSQTLIYESVTVPAGTFMAYKIVTTANGTRFREGWYSPEVRGLVKSVNYSTTSEVTNLLVDYQKTDDPVEEISSQ